MKKQKNHKILKKIICILISVVIVVGCLYYINIPGETKSASISLFGTSQMQIAHRGLSATAPENTVEAFLAAGEAGFYGIETDVHSTKDGVLIVMHDDEIDRTTNGTGSIEDLTWDEIQQFAIDTGNGIEKYNEVHIPTLDEYLAVCERYNCIPYIELKKLDTSYLPELFEELEAHHLRDKAVLISFSMEYLKTARGIDNSMQMMFLSNKLTKEQVDECIKYNFGIDFDFFKLIKYADAFSYAKKNNLEFATWTVDYPLVADFMHLLGVDYITTNRIVPSK